MDVVCDRCKTEYEFDDALVSERGTTVKCTHCSHQFKIYRNGPPGNTAKTWSLKRSDGTTVPFDSLSMLQKWILDGKVSKSDEISRPGEPWKPLGAIAELESFFANADPNGVMPQLAGSIPSPLTRAPLAVSAPMVSTNPLSRQSTPFQGTGGRSPAVPGVPAPGLPTPRPLVPRPPSLPGSTGTLRPAAVPPPVPKSAQKIPLPGSPLPPAASHFPPPPRMPLDLGAPTPQLPRVSAPTAQALAPSDPPHRPRQPDPTPRPKTPPITPPGTDSSAPHRLPTPVPSSFPAVVQPPKRLDSLGDDHRDYQPISPSSRLSGMLVGVALGTLVITLGVVGAWRLGFFGPHPAHPTAVATGTPVGPMLIRARALWLRGDRHSLEEARDELTRALGASPHNHIAQATRAEVMASWCELLQQRATDVESRVSIPGSDAPAMRAEAALMRREADERAQQARADQQNLSLEAAAASAAERPTIEALLGDVSRILNDRAAARQHLAAARGAPDTEFFTALLDRDEGNTDVAAAALQTVIRREEGNARARIALARIAMSRNDADTARAQLDAVGRAYARHEDATELAVALTRNEPPMRRPEPPTVAAVTPAHTPTPDVNPSGHSTAQNPTPPTVASGSSGNSYDALVAEGARLQNDGRSQQARERFVRALALRPNSAEALTGIGYSDLDMHNYPSAISRFRQALSSNANYSEALIGLGEAYSSRGDYPEALRAYNQYLEVNPGGSHASMARRQIESLQDRIQNDRPAGPTRATPPPETPHGPDNPPDNPSNTPPSA